MNTLQCCLNCEYRTFTGHCSITACKYPEKRYKIKLDDSFNELSKIYNIEIKESSNNKGGLFYMDSNNEEKEILLEDFLFNLLKVFI